MSAAQLLNPKAESRVRFSLGGEKCGLLTVYREEVKLSGSILMLVRVCKMS
jgi:hypothetical protein